MSWDGEEPKIGNVYSDTLEDLFGPSRAADEELTARHKNIAASVQAMYEKSLLHLLDQIYAETKMTDLALQGDVP